MVVVRTVNLSSLLMLWKYCIPLFYKFQLIFMLHLAFGILRNIFNYCYLFHRIQIMQLVWTSIILIYHLTSQRESESIKKMCVFLFLLGMVQVEKPKHQMWVFLICFHLVLSSEF